jgi:putative transposase
MPSGRTSTLVLQANDLLATHPTCSEKRHNQPCRRPHERKLGDQTKDDADKEPREERSCGRSQTSLYNNERPHQALNMQCPAQRYRPSPRPYRGLPDIEYPFHDRAATVTTCGRICFNRQKINLSQVFAGQTVGIKQTDDRIWLVSFMDYDLRYFDDETGRLEPLANPFGPKVLPMSSE